VDGVTVDPPTINVRIPITSVVGLKLVPVQATISGLPEPGYVITAVQVDPPLIALTGSSGPLDAAAVLGTEPIDISGARGQLVREGQLVFPKGTSPQIGEPTSVQVTILVAQVAQMFQVSLPAAVRLNGLENGLIASLTPDLVTLAISGKSDLLDQLAQQTLAVTVDVSGLGPGSYEVPVSIRLPEGITLAAPAPQVTVILRTVTATLTPTEPLSATTQPTTEGATTPTPTAALATASPSPSQPVASETATHEGNP
ncbi:MAG: hypothetical protein HGA65_21230, partial [Oscillochloris sp.]|nr:hypothetical protein [Oscillochloris sp.]